MSLAFTDAQIQSLTQQIIDAPTLIAQANANKVTAQANQAAKLATDDQNGVFTTHYINIITQYHAEIKYLNGTLYTDYDASNIPTAGQLLDGVHFPKSPAWTKFQPKVDASNNGNPTSVFANTETEATGRATSYISLMQSGFSDGSGSTTLTGAPTGSVYPFTATTGFSVGNRVLITQGTSSFVYGTITNITSLNVTITSTLSSGSLSSGAAVVNHKAGYTTSQIETTTTDPWLTALKSAIDLGVSDWKTRLQAELTALNANDSELETSQITAAKTQVNGHITNITTWQARPSTGSGLSRFGTFITGITSEITTRSGEYTARATQITTALGSVTQATDGSFTGTGWYKTLFDNLNLRLNLAGGTLRSYYDAALGVTLYDQAATNATNTASRNTSAFTICYFAQDANGTNQVTVTSVSGITTGDTVKVMSSTQTTVLTATISAISGLVVTLSVSIPATYKAADHGRVVKQN